LYVAFLCLFTLWWPLQNQKKKPAAVSKGASAILGEAADVVAGKYAIGPGGPNSPYLNRLSEIQVQDESYIHQQLVKPDEGEQQHQVTIVPAIVPAGPTQQSAQVAAQIAIRFSGMANP
jgi:hypothetical protein